MFSLAIQQSWRETNPCRGIEQAPENKRERFLTGPEIARLMAELDKHPRQESANAVRLLLLTGARLGEVLSAEWAQFDLDIGVWTKPAATTKQKKLHRLPLNAAALTLLREMRAAADAALAERRERGRIAPVETALFPGRASATQQSVRTFWEGIRERAGIGDVHLHDLRHTHASILASQGLSLPIIGQLLGHTQPATTHRYAHLLDQPLREATERVGKFVAEATAAGAGRVLPLRRP
jgi:integrase